MLEYYIQIEADVGGKVYLMTKGGTQIKFTVCIALERTLEKSYSTQGTMVHIGKAVGN